MVERARLCPPSNVTVIRYGIDNNQSDGVEPTAIADLRSSWGAGEEAYVIGTVARLAPQKSLDVLLKAFATYHARATIRSRLVIVGTGPLEAELKQLASELGIASEVVFAGFREDIPAVIKAFNLFVLSSRYEGFGLVLLEAMSAARPVVASRVSAIPEVVEEGVSGLLADAGDVGAFAEKFALFEEPARRLAFGQAGRERARAEFGLDEMIDRTLALYEEVGRAKLSV
jgi:glycosyltransferase involved in cell wall biosynthesis